MVSSLKQQALKSSHSKLLAMPNSRQGSQKQAHAKQMHRAYRKANSVFANRSDSESQDAYRFPNSPVKSVETISDSENSHAEQLHASLYAERQLVPIQRAPVFKKDLMLTLIHTLSQYPTLHRMSSFLNSQDRVLKTYSTLQETKVFS